MCTEVPLKRVLLTDAGGFIGRQCLGRLVESGYEVHALSRAERKVESGIHWYSTDLFKSGGAERLLDKVRPTHLLHLAWYAEPSQYWTATENFQWVRASLALLQAFAAQGGQRVYGWELCRI